MIAHEEVDWSDQVVGCGRRRVTQSLFKRGPRGWGVEWGSEAPSCSSDSLRVCPLGSHTFLRVRLLLGARLLLTRARGGELAFLSLNASAQRGTTQIVDLAPYAMGWGAAQPCFSPSSVLFPRASFNWCSPPNKHLCT